MAAVEIQPTRGLLALDLRELWRYRELLFFLVWRDVKVRYKQTVLGATWAILQPVATMVIFTIIFGRFAGIPSDGVPYPIFAYCGLLPWTYFAGALTQSSGSVVGQSALVTKVFFPRLLIPLSAVLVPLVDAVLASTVLVGLMAWYGIWPGAAFLLAPCFLLLALVAAFGVGLWLSALSVRYRDVPFVIPFLIQFWLFASPVIYPVSVVPEAWRWVLSLNPMVGVIDGMRWALLDRDPPDVAVVATSIGAALVLLVSGLVFFRRFERRFADVI
jgi:lipopolysaccharide transport system permease protein